MSVVLRIVCVFAVFCEVLSAPTVTYDQRQQGEFNLQVDMDDISIVLLPGGGFAQRNALSDKVQQVFSRRNGASPKKKHKKPISCTTTTGKPETSYSSESPPPYVPESNGEVPTSGVENLSVVLEPVSEINLPIGQNDKKISNGDPYSVTPSTTNFSEINIHPVEIENSNTFDSAEPVTVKAVESPAVGAVETVTELTEMVVVKTINKSTDDTLKIPNNPESIKTDVKPIEKVSINFEEKPVSISSDVKILEKNTNEKTNKDEQIPTHLATENKLYEMSTVKVVDKYENPKIMVVESSLKTKDIPAEMVAMTTLKKPTSSKTTEQIENPIIHNESVEMVAMKMMEKPNFSETLQAIKSVLNTNTVKTEVTETSVISLTNSNKKPMADKKTIEQISDIGSTETVEKTEITTISKPVEIQDNKNTQNKPNETIISRSAPKHTEMVSMKTVEHPATISTIKSVTSIKTLIKSGTPKTIISTNGSSVMQKVGDRKPLPQITFEVAPAKLI